MEKVFIIEETGEKIIGTFEGEYEVPKGRREESMKKLLKKYKNKLIK